jgi:PPOX class probable F420-dependent enzyme
LTDAPTVPNSHLDLLTRPLFGHLATTRPDGRPQVNPMWFSWDGSRLRFTGTVIRFKYRNITHDPRVAVSINDPDRPYRYLEIRGTVTAIEPDPQADFFLTLAERYALPMDGPPGDAQHRIIYVVSPEQVSYQ